MYQPTNTPIYGTSYNPNIPYNYQYLPTPSFSNINNDAIALTGTHSRENEKKNIEDFLVTLEHTNELSERNIIYSASKISNAKNALSSAFILNKKLGRICAELNDHENLPVEVWQENIKFCKQLKSEITELLTPFEDTKFLCELKMDVVKRKRKRLREKLKKEKWKSEKQARNERRAQKHAEIDSWIRKEQAVIEKEKQEVNLRKDADMILSDVRGKRSDARKYLGLLKELKNLRNVKANIAKARGEHLSSAADEAFNNIIAKLTEQWIALDREYSIEEQGLKLMLKTDNDKRIETQKRNVFDDWEYTLFGKKVLSSDHTTPDLGTFVAYRCAWDKYINSDSDATPIPIGWVLPDKPSSAAWQKCLWKERY